MQNTTAAETLAVSADDLDVKTARSLEVNVRTWAEMYCSSFIVNCKMAFFVSTQDGETNRLFRGRKGFLDNEPASREGAGANKFREASDGSQLQISDISAKVPLG